MKKTQVKHTWQDVVNDLPINSALYQGILLLLESHASNFPKSEKRLRMPALDQLLKGGVSKSEAALSLYYLANSAIIRLTFRGENDGDERDFYEVRENYSEANEEDFVDDSLSRMLFDYGYTVYYELNQKFLDYYKRRWSGEIGVGIRAKDRQVNFKKTGDFYVADVYVGRLKPFTAEYYFLEFLWDNFDTAVSNEGLYDYCRSQLHKKPPYSIEDFSHKTKYRLKTFIKPEVIEMVIEPDKTQDGRNGYRLTNPK